MNGSINNHTSLNNSINKNLQIQPQLQMQRPVRYIIQSKLELKSISAETVAAAATTANIPNTALNGSISTSTIPNGNIHPNIIVLNSTESQSQSESESDSDSTDLITGDSELELTAAAGLLNNIDDDCGLIIEEIETETEITTVQSIAINNIELNSAADNSIDSDSDPELNLDNLADITELEREIAAETIELQSSIADDSDPFDNNQLIKSESNPPQGYERAFKRARIGINNATIATATTYSSPISAIESVSFQSAAQILTNNPNSIPISAAESKPAIKSEFNNNNNNNNTNNNNHSVATDLLPQSSSSNNSTNNNSSYNNSFSNTSWNSLFQLQSAELGICHTLINELEDQLLQQQSQLNNNTAIITELQLQYRIQSNKLLAAERRINLLNSQLSTANIELFELNNRLLCNYCNSRLMQLIALPCMHLSICKVCAASIQQRAAKQRFIIGLTVFNPVICAKCYKTTTSFQEIKY